MNIVGTMFFKDKKYEDFLKEIRDLLKDREIYISIQREYINKLKEEHQI